MAVKTQGAGKANETDAGQVWSTGTREGNRENRIPKTPKKH